MDTKELALLLSPLVAVAVAIATVLFNHFDRRRHYALEREKLALERQKLAQEMTRALLNGAKSFEKRVELSNELMQAISGITHEAQTARRQVLRSLPANWSHEGIVQKLEQLQAIARVGQVHTTQFIHEAITRAYTSQVMTLSEHIGQALSDTRAETPSNAASLLTQVIELGDELKSAMRDDLELFVRGLTSDSLGVA
ncbi:MAG: hypothetical protein IV097_15930 [Burkholderiaceae bacterium]|nr:hypothetical protein [Burkholderiaceae bacterium]